MSKVASRIVRRGGVFQYRRRVPDDVRKLCGFHGKEITQVSLRTSDQMVARREAVKQDELFEAECARVRGVNVQTVEAVAPGMGMVLTDAYLKSIQDRYVAVALKVDVEETLAAQSDPELRDFIDRRDDWLAASYRVDADGNIIDKAGSDARRRQVEIEDIKRNAEAFVRFHAQSFGAGPGSVDYRRIENAIVEAELKVNDAKRARHSGVTFGDAYRPSDASGPRPRAESAWTMKKLAERYLKVTPSGLSWQHKVNVAVDLFEQFLGRPTPISAITRDHMREFFELLAVCPQRASMRFPGLTLKDAVDANHARQRPYPVIDPNTIRDNHFAVIRKLFG